MAGSAVSSDDLRKAALSARDSVELFAVRGDPRVMEHWDWPADTTPEATARVVNTMLGEVARGEAHYWSLRQASTGRLVGTCDLSDLHGEESADIGFLLSAEFWGQGYGREVIEFLLEQARGLRLARLHARVHAGNNRSIRLLRAAGFAGVARSTLEVRPGVFRDCLMFERQV